MIEIQFDQNDVEEKLKKLDHIKDGAVKVLKRTFSRTGTGMKTDATKEIRAAYIIKKASDVREHIGLSKGALSVVMHSKGRPIRSVKFAYKPNTNPGKRDGSGTAVFLNVKKSSSGDFLEGKDSYSKAFVTKMANNDAVGIFQRTGVRMKTGLPVGKNVARIGKNKSKYRRRTKTAKGRENIEQIRGPGVAEMLNEPDVKKNIQEKAIARFTKNLDHEISYLLSKEGGN